MEDFGAGTIYLNDSNWNFARHLFVCLLFILAFSFPSKLMWKNGYVFPCIYKETVILNKCMFPIASNLFVLLLSVACTVNIQTNCYLVMNAYFTGLYVEPYEVLVLLRLKWGRLENSPYLEVYAFYIICNYDMLLINRNQNCLSLIQQISTT